MKSPIVDVANLDGFCILWYTYNNYKERKMHMPQDKVKKLHLIYGIIATALILALGVALIIACRDIYTSGPRPYTRAAIGGKLQDMAVLLWANLFAIIAGIVLNITLPLPRAKTKAVRDELITMQKLAAKAGTPSLPQQQYLEREQRNRWMYRVVTAGVFGGLLSRPAFYLLDKANFPAVDPTAEIMAAALIVLPPAIIGLLGCYVCSLLTKRSIIKETEIYKQIIAEGNKATPNPDTNLIIIDKRGIVSCIILSFFTFGIYYIYWKYLLIKNSRMLKNDHSDTFGELICFAFVPFYSYFWWITRGKRTKEILTSQGYSVNSNEVIFLILAIFGLEIVSMSIMQSDFNGLSDEYSDRRTLKSSGSYRQSYESTDKAVLLKTVRFVILAVALAFIVVGIFNGSANDVLTKAIKICTECIGLG